VFLERRGVTESSQLNDIENPRCGCASTMAVTQFATTYNVRNIRYLLITMTDEKTVPLNLIIVYITEKALRETFGSQKGC
jgi:hypothetical protein